MAAAVVKSVNHRKELENKKGSNMSINAKDVDPEESHIIVAGEDWSPSRKWMLWLLQTHRFEALCACVILFNMLLVIAETDASVDDGEPSGWIVYTTYALLCFYICELASKLFVLRLQFFREMWNVLDFTIVSVDIILLILGVVVSNMPSVSVLRVFRLVRLARAFRAAKSFKELNALIRSFGFALKAIFWGILMIIMILSIWSILAVQLLHPINARIYERNPEIYDGCVRCPDAFSSVFNSMLTFFQHVVAGDSWGNVSLPVITEEPWTALLFLMVIVTVNLTMLNLILAVIVEAGAKAVEEDMHEKAIEAQRKIRKAEARLIELCCTLDKDASGSLNIEEFLSGYAGNQEFADCLESMNVTQSDIHMIFNICDEDGSGDVNYVEFVEQLRRIRKQGEQMLLYYVTEIRHKVQQLKLKLIDHHDSTTELKDPFLDEAEQDEAMLLDGTYKSPEQMLATKDGDIAELERLAKTGMAELESFAKSEAIAKLDGIAQPVAVEKQAGQAEVMVISTPRTKDAIVASDRSNGRVVPGQIGKDLVLRSENLINGINGRLSGRKVECVITGVKDEDKLTLCSVQLDNILRINHDIADIMKDVVSQSKLHTGLLNTLAAEVPQARESFMRANCCIPQQPAIPRVI